MSETPIFTMLAEKYQLNLSDSDIEGRSEPRVDQGRINLFEEQAVDPTIFETPEINHRVVQPPIFEMQPTLSHEQQLHKSVEAIPDSELVTGAVTELTTVGRNLEAVRSSAQGRHAA